MVDGTMIGLIVAGGIGLWLCWKNKKKIWDAVNKGLDGSPKPSPSPSSKKNNTEDFDEIIRYRGEDYEIDWEGRRFLKVWKDNEGDFKSKPVRLPAHVWYDVFGEEEGGDEYE